MFDKAAYILARITVVTPTARTTDVILINCDTLRRTRRKPVFYLVPGTDELSVIRSAVGEAGVIEWDSGSRYLIVSRSLEASILWEFEVSLVGGF